MSGFASLSRAITLLLECATSQADDPDAGEAFYVQAFLRRACWPLPFFCVLAGSEPFRAVLDRSWWPRSEHPNFRILCWVSSAARWAYAIVSFFPVPLFSRLCGQVCSF